MPRRSSGRDQSWLKKLFLVQISSFSLAPTDFQKAFLLFCFCHTQQLSYLFEHFPTVIWMQNLHDIFRLLTFGWAIQGNCFVDSNQWLGELEQIVAWKCSSFVFLSSHAHNCAEHFSSIKPKLANQGHTFIHIRSKAWHFLWVQKTCDKRVAL